MAALQELRRMLEQNEERARLLLGTAGALVGQRDEGRRWIDVIESDDGSRVIQLLTDSTQSLVCANATFRRALAKALHDDGVTMARVAEVLGVTRQRVARLLDDDDS